MKAKIRVATDMYEFIEPEVEGELDYIWGVYKELKGLATGQSVNALPTKEFNQFLDQYLTDKTGNLEVYNKMSPAQQEVIQQIKKAFARFDYKNNRK